MHHTPTVLADVIERNARYFPGKTAVVFEGRRVTYAELATRVRRLANVLASWGLQRQARFAVLAQNCLEYFEAVGAAVGTAVGAKVGARVGAGAEVDVGGTTTVAVGAAACVGAVVAVAGGAPQAVRNASTNRRAERCRKMGSFQRGRCLGVARQP